MMKNYPDLNPLYDEVVDYVREHQGEKGYIDCQPFMDEPGDTIYGLMFNEATGRGEEMYVYGVRVRDDELECLLENISRTYRVKYAEEDFTSEEAEWVSVRWSDIYYIPTLFEIAEYIEEYA